MEDTAMQTTTRRTLPVGLGWAMVLGAAFALIATTSAAWAQPSPPVRIRGQIEKVDGNNLTIKSRDGATLNVKLADNARLMAFVPASLADIKPNSYIGVAAMPQPDGTQKAVSVHIFLESMRGVGEGFRPWDKAPGSTMTNAAVETTVSSVDGQVMTLKYKGGEKKVVVPPGTPIVTYAPANKDEVKPGAQIIIMGAQKQPDGSLTAPSMNIGRGIAPPM
jgi:outer membrane lipoprotein SlyB